MNTNEPVFLRSKRAKDFFCVCALISNVREKSRGSASVQACSNIVLCSATSALFISAGDSADPADRALTF